MDFAANPFLYRRRDRDAGAGPVLPIRRPTTHPISAGWRLALGVSLCLLGGCRPTPPSESASPAPAVPAAAEETPSGDRDKTAAEAPGEPEVAHLQEILFLSILGDKEWKQGDTVVFRTVVENRDAAAISDLELRCEIQFGLTDTIGEGRWRIPLGELPPGGLRALESEYWATKPGIWHVKAALYRQEALIEAAARTFYIRETEQTREPSPAEAPIETGPPLVENPAALTRLNPERPIWVDAEKRSVVLIGRVCQRQCSLELFACVRNTKEHESIVSIAVPPSLVHAGLLAVGAEPGRPVQFYPEYVPAQGPEVEIRLLWKDENGDLHEAPAQDWVRNAQTGRALEYPWIFTGSQMLKEEEGSDREYYYADATGELICVSNFPSAVLDLPIRSSDSNEALLFEASTERIPPLGTEVTLILTPKPASEQPAAPPDGE